MIGLGIATGLGSLFGNLLGFGSNIYSAKKQYDAQIAANKANMQMNRENIATAQQMFDRQMSYNREIYEDQKAYNSASSQRARLEAAGLNPYMMMSGGNAGSVTASSAPSYSQPSMIPMQAASFNLDATPLVNAASTFYDNKLKEAQIEKTQAEGSSAWQDANYKRTFNNLQVARAIADLDGVSQDNKGKMLDNYIKQNTAEYAVQSAKYDNEFKFQQIRSLALDSACKQANLPFVAKRAQLEIDNMASDLLSKQKSRKLTDAQIKDVYASVLLKHKQRWNMPNLTKQQADQLAKYMVDSAQGAAEESLFRGAITSQDKQNLEIKSSIPAWIKKFGSVINEISPLKGW